MNVSASTTGLHRPFLKWPGGKFRLVGRLREVLPEGKRLIEPFVGSGAVFLNTQYPRYLLNDNNPDLIHLYLLLQQQGQDFILHCREYFTDKNNSEKRYYQFRKKFNASRCLEERSALFLYLNRHGYNGLCRYNQGKGEFNVPFGRYVRPYFPAQEMLFFHEKSQAATFICGDYANVVKRGKPTDVIYCDPPYVPLTPSASFTQYSRTAFGLKEQERLAQWAYRRSLESKMVVVSNHASPITYALYHKAELLSFPVARFISCKATSRKPVEELFAVYRGKK